MTNRSEFYFVPEVGLKGFRIMVEDHQQIRGHILVEDFLLPAHTLVELSDRLRNPATIERCYIGYYSLRWTDWFAVDFQQVEIFSEGVDLFVNLHGHIEWDYEDDGIRTVAYQHHRLWPDG